MNNYDEIISNILDLADKNYVTEEVLNIILKTHNISELEVLQNGLQKMLDRNSKNKSLTSSFWVQPV